MMRWRGSIGRRFTRPRFMTRNPAIVRGCADLAISAPIIESILVGVSAELAKSPDNCGLSALAGRIRESVEEYSRSWRSTATWPPRTAVDLPEGPARSLCSSLSWVGGKRDGVPSGPAVADPPPPECGLRDTHTFAVQPVDFACIQHQQETARSPRAPALLGPAAITGLVLVQAPTSRWRRTRRPNPWLPPKST
jgi:hypothetical protein